MNIVRLVDAFGGWWYRSRWGRELRRLWCQSHLARLFGRWWHRTRSRKYRYKSNHLYEVVISNARMWFKLQASCWSSRQAAMFLESRFNGTNYITVDGHQPVTPFRLSKCSNYIDNWNTIVDGLPDKWDDEEYQIEGFAYSWCETLSNDCECGARKGRLDVVYCSDYGTQDEADRKKTKTRNVWYESYIKSLETNIVRREETQRKEGSLLGQQQKGSDSNTVFLYPKVAVGQATGRIRIDVPKIAINRIRQMEAAGYYCSIDKRHHSYGEQPLRRTIASLNAACEQISGSDDRGRKSVMSQMANVAEHYLQVYQSEECAQKSVWGDVDIPNILYKYIPKELIGKGAPNSLRATQLLALNDDMECNVITMKDTNQHTLDLLRIVRAKLKEHLGIMVAWDELLEQPLRYGNPRLSPYIQKYLNPLVGVASFTTDICVPTMWTHYARNTGIVVGYDTQALKTLGFELRPVVYSEIAPTYRPLSSDDIKLDFVDREYMENATRAGQKTEGFTLLASTRLTEFGADWRSLARLLFVKGISWTYEKEVRLLVDLQQACDTGKKDDNGWPIKVINIPPEAIKEIYGGSNTLNVDVERAVQASRGENKKGLFTGRLSSHAFRIQKTGGSHH